LGVFVHSLTKVQSRWRGGIYLPGSGDNRCRPVYVGDVAAILAMMVKDDKGMGRVVELYGFVFLFEN
jgi:hypothetical protein